MTLMRLKYYILPIESPGCLLHWKTNLFLPLNKCPPFPAIWSYFHKNVPIKFVFICLTIFYMLYWNEKWFHFIDDWAFFYDLGRQCPLGTLFQILACPAKFLCVLVFYTSFFHLVSPNYFKLKLGIIKETGKRHEWSIDKERKKNKKKEKKIKFFYLWKC